MKLKKIILKGFKSFPKKTVIDCRQGINIIIGPNGSGKSNIVDAIRWTMGEKKVKSLRGSEMLDFIFKGTEKIPASGYAEVEMIFDNSSRTLRMDVDDVSIKRIFDRDSEGKFYINDKRSRAKDIMALFGETGFSSNGYAIIEQGQVEKFISYSALERRAIFEEAAGVMAEKAQKIDVEKKLIEINENLNRLTDLMLEKDKIHDQLKRAVGKYDRYISVKGQLDGKKKLHFAKKHLHFLKEIEQFDEKKNPLYIEKSEIVKKIAALEVELNRTDDEIKKFWNSHQVKMDGKLGLSDAIGKKEKEKTVLESDISVRVNRIKEDEGLIGENEEKVKKYGEMLEEWEKRRTILVENNERIGENIRSLEKEIGNGQNELTELKEEYVGIESEYINFTGKISGSENEKIELSSARSNNDNQIMRLHARLESFDERIKTYAADLSDIDRDIERVGKKLADFNAEDENIKNNIAELEKRFNDLAAQYGKMSVEFESSKERIKMLENLLNNYEGYSEGIKNLMAKYKKGDDTLSGIHDTVANVISYSSEHATALEVAFGQTLQYLIVETEEDAKKAIQYLNRSHGGRVTFLPLTSEKDNTKNFDLPLSGGVIGRAEELYSAQETYKSVIDKFVRNVIIVKDMDCASQLKDKLRNRTYKIVTLNGELFYSDGRIVGGKRKEEKGLLVLKDQMQTERDALKEKEKALNDLELEHRDTFFNKEQAQKKLEERQQQREFILSEMRKFSDDRITIESNIKNIKDNKSVEEETIAMLEKDNENILTKIAELDGVLEKIKGDNQDLKERYDQYSGTLMKLQGAINDKMLEKNKCENDLGMNNNDLKNIQDNSIHYEELRSAAVSDIEYYKKEIAECRKAIELNSKKNAELTAEITELTGRLNSFNEEIEKYSADIEKEENNRKKLKEEVESREIRLGEIESLLADSQSLKNELNVQAQLFEQHLRELLLPEEPFEDIIKSAIEDQTVPEELENEVKTLTEKIERMGPINFEAKEEFDKFTEEYELLKANVNDIIESKKRLEEIIEKVNTEICEKLTETIQNINVFFSQTFQEIFEGGDAKVVMTDPANPLETGIDIEVRLPGKNISTRTLFSGGEKALVTAALLFAIFLQNPTPLCVLDEMDAPLDEVNIMKFFNMIKKFSENIQFIVVTHNKKSMEFADVMYGVTMEEKGVSKVMSVEFKGA